jgi:Leucine-rich repeat (LRR) protein
LPVEVGALNRLQTLDMSHNILSTLPHELCFMKSLSWIDLSHNNIDCLPEHFGSLRNLRVLKLSNNKLKGVPKTFYQLENVHELDLSSNYLREVEIGLCEGLVSLKEANFESNRIKHLPQQICTMPLLERLNLRHNDLNSLPLDLANSQIQVDIAQNPLHDLPFKFHSRPNDSINNMNTAYQNPSGYTKEDVNDWMKKEDLLYKPAVDEWNMKKTLYMSGDLSYDNYMSGVIWRCENVYRDMDTMAFKEDRMVIKRVKQFYFHCKKYGNPPLYIQRSYEENKRREDDAAHLLECREERFKVARDIDMKRRAEEYETYFGNLSHRCSSADDRFKKYKDEKATLEKAETQKLLDNVTHKMIEKDKLDTEKEKIEKISLKKETERLNALSFQSHRNKKRFLPIEIDPCWKSDQDTIININHQRIT